MSTRLSIITPCYYNADSLPAYKTRMDELEQEFAKLNVELELILIDDGSKDDTYGALLKLKSERPKTKIIKLTRNFGAVAASSVGFNYVTGDCFTVLAADLQDPPELLMQMFKQWQAGEKYIICRRTERKDPFFTRIFASLYYRLLQFFVLADYPEGGFDMLLLDKQLLPHVQERNGRVNFQLYTYWLGFKPHVIEYERQEREHGKSRWTFRKKFNLLLDNLTGFSVTPLRMVTAVGLGISLVSILYALNMIISGFFQRSGAPGFATLAVLISFSSGIIMAMLAIIGEYIWRIFEVVHNKPTSVIDSEHLEESL